MEWRDFILFGGLSLNRLAHSGILAPYALIIVIVVTLVTAAFAQPEATDEEPTAEPTAPIALQPPAPVNVIAGIGERNVTWNDFLPGNVRIAEGGTVTWTVTTDEPHTVTFLAGQPRPNIVVPQPEGGNRPPMFDPAYVFPTIPAGPWDGTTYVNSADLGKGQQFSLTFGTQGRFSYICLLHPPMTGTVEVVAPGTADVTTQADVDRSVAGDRARMETQVAEILRTRGGPTSIDGTNGAKTWFVRAGTDRRDGRLDIMAFLPGELTVRQGDSVVWYADHPMPHTVTFPAAGQGEPVLVNVQLPDGRLIPAPEPGQPMPPEVAALLADPANAPRLVVGPGGVPSRPSPTYDGRSFYNSGVIGDHPGIQVPTQQVWMLTFDRPGTYEYLCVLHDPLGMEGKITVTPR
jgi:plastocyanin